MTDVGDVHDAQYVIACVAQVFFQHILHDIGAQVADVGVVIDGRAAGIHLHLARLVGGELHAAVAEGVI